MSDKEDSQLESITREKTFTERRECFSHNFTKVTLNHSKFNV